MSNCGITIQANANDLAAGIKRLEQRLNDDTTSPPRKRRPWEIRRSVMLGLRGTAEDRAKFDLTATCAHCDKTFSDDEPRDIISPFVRVYARCLDCLKHLKIEERDEAKV